VTGTEPDSPCFPESTDEASPSVTALRAENTDRARPVEPTAGSWVGLEVDVRGVEPLAPDAIEAALARALDGAAAAGQWALVAQLAGELEARRRARGA